MTRLYLNWDNRPFQMRTWSCITSQGLQYLAFDNVNPAMVNSMMLRSSMLAFEKVYYMHGKQKPMHMVSHKNILGNGCGRYTPDKQCLWLCFCMLVFIFQETPPYMEKSCRKWMTILMRRISQEGSTPRRSLCPHLSSMRDAMLTQNEEGMWKTRGTVGQGIRAPPPLQVSWDWPKGRKEGWRGCMEKKKTRGGRRKNWMERRAKEKKEKRGWERKEEARWQERKVRSNRNGWLF